MVSELKTQLQNTSATVSTLKQEHANEVGAISQSYLAKIAVLKEKEENALLEIEALRSRLAQGKASIDKLRGITQQEAKILKDATLIGVGGDEDFARAAETAPKGAAKQAEKETVQNQAAPVVENSSKPKTPAAKRPSSSAKSETRKSAKDLTHQGKPAKGAAAKKEPRKSVTKKQ